MAIAHDASSSAVGTGVSSITIPAFTASGNNRLCFVGVGTSASSPSGTTSVVRGGSEIFTEIWDTSTLAFHNSGHYFVAPDPASAAVVVTLSGVDDEVVAAAIRLTGVHQSFPVGAHATAGANNDGPVTVTVTPSSTDMIVDNPYAYGQSLTIGADQTQRWQNNPIADTVGAGSTQLGSVSGVMSWTIVGSQSIWTTGAVPVQESTDPDPSGLIFRGTVVRYVNALNVDGHAYLNEDQAIAGDTVDLAILTVSGSNLVKTDVTNVPHVSTAGIFPYWLKI